MGEYGRGVTLCSQSRGYGVDYLLEWFGDKKRCRNPETFHLDRIVQTARGARTSIAQTGDDHS